MTWLVEPLQYAFMQRGMIAAFDEILHELFD